MVARRPVAALGPLTTSALVRAGHEKLPAQASGSPRLPNLCGYQPLSRVPPEFFGLSSTRVEAASSK